MALPRTIRAHKSRDVSTRAIRRRLAGPLLGLVGLVVALSMGELASRILRVAPEVKAIEVTNEQCVYKRFTNPVLGYELKANYRDDDADLNHSYPSTNSRGQRDVERTIEKPSGTRRIILLGDSVVEGHGIREIDDTMSRQLEMLYDDGRTEVLNFGVSGYCTLAEVELLEVKGLKFQPDIVLLVFVENDFDNFNIEAFQLGRAYQRPFAVHWPFVRSALFRAVCLRLNLFHYGLEHDPVRWNKQAIGDNNVAEGLERLRRLANEHGFQTAIAIWPRFTDEGIVDEQFMPDNSQQLVIERLAEMNRIAAFRLSPRFQQHRSSTGELLHPRLHYTLGDMFHPSQEGCRIAAQAIKTILDQLEAGPSVGDGPEAASRRFVHDPAAIEAAATAGRSDPGYASVQINLGAAAAAEGKQEEAIGHYREAVRMRPDYEVALHNLGLALCNHGQLEEGIRHLRRALEIQPVYADAHRNLGVALQRLGQFDESERHLREAVRIQPDFADLYSNLGFTLFAQGRFDEAVKNYRRALEIEPQYSEAHSNLGVALASRQHFDEALSHFQQAVDAAPKYSEARFNLARLLQTQDRVEEAIEQYQQVLRLTEHAGAHNNLGAAMLAKGRQDEAIGHFREALEINPDHAGARRNLEAALRVSAIDP